MTLTPSAKFLRSIALGLVFLICASVAQAAYVNGTFVQNAQAANALSLTGVTAGHQLVVWAFFDSAVTGETCTDNMGVTMTLAKAVALTSNAEVLAVFVSTSAVAAGTHSYTFAATGLSTVGAGVIEDSGTSWGTAVGQRVNSPGVGQTLTPGGVVGSGSDNVYLFAADGATASTAAQPVAGTGGFTIPTIQTGNNGAYGSYTGGYNATAGGTTPSFAPGTGGLIDEYGVIGVDAPTSGGGYTALPVYSNGKALLSNGSPVL